MFKAWATAAGGRYATDFLDNIQGNETTVTEEEILALNPDIIVVGGLVQTEVYDELLQNSNWSDIKALSNGQVYCSPIGVFPWCRFGAESALQILWAAQTFYPELFADVDLAQVTHDFYADFAGADLSEQQIQNILAGLSPDA